jgi:uncharacterized membrane protein YtjA (UPF0391 family)
VFRYAGLFYVIALGSTVLAFGGLSPNLAVFARVLFGVCLTLAFLTLVLGLMRKGF